MIDLNLRRSWRRREASAARALFISTLFFSGDDRSTSLSLSSFSNKIKNHGFSDFFYREKAVFVLERKKENKIKYCGIHLVSRMDLVSL